MWWQKLIDGYARNVVKTGEDAYRLTMGVAERRMPGDAPSTRLVASSRRNRRSGRRRLSRLFGRRDAAYFSSISAGAIVGSRSGPVRTRRGRFTESVFQP